MGRSLRRRAIAALGLALSVALTLPGATLGADLAATSWMIPGHYFVGDDAGSQYTLRVRNKGTLAAIGAVRITRPSAVWTVTDCPAGPSGWTRTPSATACVYTSAAGDGDDIPTGAVRNFTVSATTADAAGNRSGTWSVQVSSDDDLNTPANVVAATPPKPGNLGVRAHSFQITAASFASSAPTVGDVCPADDKDAAAGSTGHIVVVCGRNRTTGTLRTRWSKSKLEGSTISGHGGFVGGFIPSSDSLVVLGYWSNVAVTASSGTDKLVHVRTGTTSSRNSSWTVFGGFEAEGAPPPDLNDAPDLTSSSAAFDGISEDPGPPSGAVGTAVSSLVTLGGNVTDPDGPGLGIAIYDGEVVGSLWYSTDNGSNWTNLGTPSTANSSAALLLSATGGRLYYEPVANFHGTVTTLISFRAWDQSVGTSGGTLDIDAVGGNSSLSSLNATASLSVSALNDAPTAVNASFTMNEDALWAYSVPGVLFDASDADGDALTAVIVDLPDHFETFGLNSDGSFSYRPTANYFGSDSFSWKANDGSLDSNVATVSITILSMPDGGGGGGGCLISC